MRKLIYLPSTNILIIYKLNYIIYITYLFGSILAAGCSSSEDSVSSDSEVELSNFSCSRSLSNKKDLSLVT